jgi:hypothetical protein
MKMRTNLTLTKLFHIPSAALAAALIAGPMAALAPQPASALPSGGSCRITTYYKTDALENEVGLRSNCPGKKGWGKTSAFFEVDTIDFGNDGGGGHGGHGKFPCEFLAEGCSNLPVDRFE